MRNYIILMNKPGFFIATLISLFCWFTACSEGGGISDRDFPVDSTEEQQDSDEDDSVDDDDTGAASDDPTSTVDVPPRGSGFLHVEGSQLMDDAGVVVRLTGINWFGFETSNQCPHGLWARDYRSMLKQIADLGFNSVRLPWSNAILRDDAMVNSITTYGADAYDGTDPMNADLLDKKPVEVLDLIIEAAAEFKLKVILDNHSREPDGYMEEQLWYTDAVSEEQWISDWVFLAERYRGNTTVIAFDINNEPHGDATWGTGNSSTDWNSAAERCGNSILAVNPDVLIIVEGVEKVGGDSYWWGGNLKGVKSRPISLLVPEKLVYSAHEYGPEVFAQPWFSSGSFPGNMEGIWREYFGFIIDEGLGHVLIGEFGIKDPEAFDGVAGVWFDTFVSYLGDRYSWTFWCFNPNSGDTDGILDYDWLTPHQWKMDAITPILAPIIE